MCHWLYFKKSAWYWKNLITQSHRHVANFRSVIKQHNIDAVYTNTSAIFEPAIAAYQSSIPHLWHIHEVLKPGNQMDQLLPIKWMQRLIRKRSTQLIFESNSAREVFDQHTAVPDAKVVYNSLRLPLTEIPSQEEVVLSRKRLGIKTDRLVLTYVGQLIDRKNPMLLIRAIKQLDPEDRPFCLFVGEGPLDNQLKQEIKDYNLSEHCLVIGFKDDITDVMRACDALALPSRQESFGLVLVEAAGFGKPVIACESQGPSEIIIDGKTGFLVPQDSPVDFSEKIKALLDHKARTSMGQAGRDRIKELYCPTKNTELLTELIEQAISKDQ